MGCVVWGVCLLLGVAFNPCVEAESLYTVNSVVHSSCASTDFRLGSTNLNVERGVPAAPCVGYMNYGVSSSDFRQMCSSGDTQPTKAMAERFCYTLGLNMWRSSSIASNSYEQIRLFDCSIYTERGVDDPEGGSITPVVTVDAGYTPVGTLCVNIGSNDICMDDCYDSSIVTSDVENDCAGIYANPFWAITCSDIDECHNGVLRGCTGAFTDSCDRTKACGDNTTCNNVINGWECKCNYGYRAVNDDDDRDPYYDGCKDIDECEESEENGSYEDGEGICGYHAQCINKPGYYWCVCLRPDLYDKEEHKCRKATCPALPAISHVTPRTIPPTTPEYGDKVIYDCYKGYEVYGYEVIPVSMYSYYGYMSHSAFEVECDYSGHWKPYPLPICAPIKCKHPGNVLHAWLTGTNWYYNEKVTYTCEQGYWPKDHSSGSDYFEKTCQEDGSWSGGTTCEDIDECTEQSGICGLKAKYCINTKGSYMCSCVPWYYKDSTHDYCDAYGGFGNTRCELMESLGLCKYGKCHEGDYGEAYCDCNPGYEGALCERRIDSQALVIAIVALVLVIIVIFLCCICCCFKQQCCGHQHQDVGPAHVQPSYGVYGASPRGLPATRYVRKGVY